MGVSEHVDGRRARGAQRRADIIDATLAVITRDGAAGVSHRAVAAQAGMTTSLSTYYFATLDDLLVAALTAIADEYTRAISAIAARSGDALGEFAELIAASATTGRERALAERELSTLAARRPVLRPIARRWRESVAELARLHTADDEAVKAMVAVADGLCAGVLLGATNPDPTAIRAVLARALGL